MNPKTNRRQLLKGTIALGGISLLGARNTAATPQIRPAPAGERIRIGQMGVAHAHASKLAAYRNSPDYDVVGVCEPDEALRARAAEQPAFKGVRWMNQDELLSSPGLQAVLVETSVRDLLRTAEICVEQGKHVHIDKPAGESLPHFRRILRRAEQQGLLVQMGYMYRYNPGIQLLREFLAKGWLGEVFEVHAVMSKVVGNEDRRRFAEYPGGILFELGCHVLDSVIRILGAPESVTGFHQQVGPQRDGLSDNMLAVLRYPKVLATIKSSALEVEGFDRRHLVVCGTEGTFHIQPLDSPAVRLSLASERPGYRKGTQEVPLPKYVRYVDDAADMARVLRGQKPFDFPYEHDLTVQKVLLEACGLPLGD